jgi:hypothetical protein
MPYAGIKLVFADLLAIWNKRLLGHSSRLFSGKGKYRPSWDGGLLLIMHRSSMCAGLSSSWKSMPAITTTRAELAYLIVCDLWNLEV